MTKVKICGLTTLQDARASIESGADMLGFNFYTGSQRYIEPARCAAIVAELEADRVEALKVGVFVNSSVPEIKAIMAECSLDLAQLHGDESPTTVAAFKGTAFKAVRPKSVAEAQQDARRFGHLGPRDGPAVLIDAYRPGRYGGTGELADWGLAENLAGSAQILLAGGLTPQNIRAALTQVKPWGIDVASGVESGPGRKDLRKMQDFVQAIRNFEREAVT